MTELAPPWPASAQRLRLGDIEIDLRYRRVQRTGATQELNPRSFDLLLLFLREPHVLHTRDEIFRTVWPGVIVEDASLTSSIWQLRRALGGEAKQWIRTVSKQGYVFDPPATTRIEVLPAESRGSDAPTRAAERPPESTDTAATPTPSIEAAPATRQAPTRRTWLALAAAALAAIVAVTGIVMYRQRSVPLRVELVVQGDRAVPAEARWYAELLRDWLDWQLRAQSGVEMAYSDQNGRHSSNMAVLLAVDMPAPGDTQWHVSARFRGAHAPADITQAAPADRLVAGIDVVARDAIAALTHSSGTGTALTLDAAPAKALATGLAAERRHDWNAAIKAYEAVLEQAPGFAFARLGLARCQYRFGQLAAAQAELARAQPWIEGLPPTLRRPVVAQEKLIRQDYAGAASDYAELQKSGGDTAPYRIAEAVALSRSGHNNEAAERLRGDVPTEPAEALDWLLERVVVESANRDLAHADTDAANARELARTLGYDHAYAWATLGVAELQVIGDKPADPALFAEAVRAFEAAGDRFGALRARVAGELERTGVSDDPPHLDELLAEARLAGNSGVEIDVLRNVADFQSSRGNLQRAHERYAQAAAVAQAAGNQREQRELDLHLLEEDLERLDFDSLNQRIARLRGEPMQGRIAFAVGFTMVQMHQLRGDYDAALAEQRQAEKALLATAEDTPFAAVLICQRATLALQQGRIAAARNDFRECRNSGIASVAQYADLGEAELAMNTGDAATARRLLAPLPEQIAQTDDLQERWGLSEQVAVLLLPVGQSATARRLVEDALPGVTRAGYKLSEAGLHNTLAQIALSEDHLDLAAHEADLADAFLPQEVWQEQRRLRSVRVALAIRQGERALATQRLSALHEEARSHGDVLAELQAHGLADAAGLTIAGCSPERRDELLAQSGMRGASDAWLLGSTAKVIGKTP